MTLRRDPSPEARARGWRALAFFLVAGLTTVALASPSGHAQDAVQSPPEAHRARVHYTFLGYPALDGPISVHLDPSESPLPHAVTLAVWREAIAAWREAGVPIDESDEADTATIRLSWHGRGHPDCTSVKSWERDVAHSGLAPDHRFIHFRSDGQWSARGDVGCGLYQATLHELGHTLGIGHSDDPAAVMHDQYRVENDEIGPSDLAALETLRGRDATTGARPGDLWTVRFRPDGRPASAELLAAAATDGRQFTLVDFDADGRDELATWIPGYQERFGFIVHRFHGPGRIQTFGPYPYVVDDSFPVRFGHLVPTASGGGTRVVLLHLLPAGRYRATVFDPRRIQPAHPWPTGRPVVTVDGIEDRDGDGHLERAEPSFVSSPPAPVPPGYRPVGEGDLDGDGALDLLAYDGETKHARWCFGVASDGAEARLGPTFAAEDPVVATLEKDGPVVVITRIRPSAPPRSERTPK